MQDDGGMELGGKMLETRVLTFSERMKDEQEAVARQELARIKENIRICVTVVIILTIAVTVTMSKIFFYDRQAITRDRRLRT